MSGGHVSERATLRAGGQEWLELWRSMYDAERAQGEAATDPAFGRHADAWAGRAARYAAASRRNPMPDSFMRWLEPQLRADDVVADVGAGSGRYLPSLARRAAEVIAVEPSAAMRGELEAVVAAEGLGNVRVIAESWPLEGGLEADVVISAHVVYGVREIGPFLEGLNRAARRLSALYLGLRHPTWALAPFWERMHGQPRLPLPAALEALAACHQLGLPAQLALVPAPAAFRFLSRADALEDLYLRLQLTPSATRDAALQAAMDELLVPTEDGMLMPRTQQRHAAVVWWEPVA
jgi:SAM-dependent methyltransferase